jgi:hypothetical protein
VFTPQRTLDDPPVAVVTENVSVRHCEAVEAPLPAVLGAPFKILTVVVAKVLGPVMTKVLKSNLSWQMLLLQGQIRALQLPAVTPLDSK